VRNPPISFNSCCSLCSSVSSNFILFGIGPMVIWFRRIRWNSSLLIKFSTFVCSTELRRLLYSLKNRSNELRSIVALANAQQRLEVPKILFWKSKKSTRLYLDHEHFEIFENWETWLDLQSLFVEVVQMRICWNLYLWLYQVLS